MSPNARRIVIPIVVCAAALLVFALYAFYPGRPQGAGGSAAEARVEQAGTAGAEAEGEGEGATAEEDGVAAASPEAEAEGVSASEDSGGVPDLPALSLEGLRARAPEGGMSGHGTPAASLGSLDPEDADMLIEFTRNGAGIDSLVFSNIWERAEARRQAEAHHRGLKKGDPSAPPLPKDEERYQLVHTQTGGRGFPVSALSTHQITINDTNVPIIDFTTDADGNRVYVWSETAPGQFETEIVNGEGELVLHIVRRFVLRDHYGLTIEQRITNLTGGPLEVRWSQFGPGGLRTDRSKYMDRRRLRLGYLLSAEEDPTRALVLSQQEGLLERRDVLKKKESDLWPSEEAVERGYELSWFGATNRYFALAVHPVLDEQNGGSRAVTEVVERILHEEAVPDPKAPKGEQTVISTYLVSPRHVLESGEVLTLDLGVYAGPLDRMVLKEQEPYVSLGMGQLILYQMSSCCAVCTFQWLANGLLYLLEVMHDWVVFDWGVAIIILVIVVRALLHPITKRSQVNMQRFGKVMQELKPEIDKLQKKYANDPKKLQQEQMRMMRERGANPLQMMGCLPMFLQTPIWIALYAMLYFAFDLRQEPAFYGFFQLFWHWPFLADLSAADHMLGEFAEPTKFFFWNVTGINFLPILMGIIFFVQQKYMSPPPSPTMTQEQMFQQKMMKVMFVVMFPVMLYSAPSGLTLYILTSSSIGIFESRYIRRHMKEMDLKPKRKARKKVKPKDAQGRAYTAMLERMEEQKRRKQKGPAKRYKKRQQP